MLDFPFLSQLKDMNFKQEAAAAFAFLLFLRHKNGCHKQLALR